MRYRYKRILFYAAMIIVCYLLDTTVLNHILPSKIKPNLLIAVVSVIGLMRGKKEGVILGVASGLLLDVLSGSLLGFYALIYLLIGYLNGKIHHVFYVGDVKLPFIMIAISDVLYGLAVYFGLFFLKSDFRMFYYLGRIILPETIYTTLLMVIFYYGILKMNQILEKDEERSAGRFV